MKIVVGEDCGLSRSSPMDERRTSQRLRTLRRGKILFNGKRSVIDCIVRNRSDRGAKLELQSIAGVPTSFELQIEGEKNSYPCAVIWQAKDCIGVDFAQPRQAAKQAGAISMNYEAPALSPTRSEHMRGELLTLRSALDDVPFGIVLLDAEMRAQFINRAFRRIWRLPDAKADAKPAFVSLMHHGWETLAYAVPNDQRAAHIEMRVAQVRAGDRRPHDLRLRSGEVIRFQCTVLPSGGRMLSYHYVTDIVRQTDELKMLGAALDNIEPGVILLDERFIVQYTNPSVRRLWQMSEEHAASHPSFAELVNTSRKLQSYAVLPENLDEYIAARIARIRSGDSTPYDMRLSDGRVIRSQCAVLPGGGRMITYNDITDLAQHAEVLSRIAAIDELTGISNRRHFIEVGEAEWSRFQRYQRPLSILSLDIDHFKLINDKYGHDVGDVAISYLARRGLETKRSSDTLARIGGDEFAMLLPETDLSQAEKLAGRLRTALRERPLEVEGAPLPLTLSIGIAEATFSMSGLNALMKAADRALYEAKGRGRNQAVCYSEHSANWLNAAE